ncbi:FliH/SctL family protein [Chromatium okenii]|nr:FliH/SctL family protein [Chromatium okenii]
MIRSSSPAANSARLWEPPDVSPVNLPMVEDDDDNTVENFAEPVMPLPTPEEVTAIQEAARIAGEEAGYQTGYQAGYDAGNALALQRAAVEEEAREQRELALRDQQEEMLKVAVQALENIAHALSDPLADSVDALEPELLLLVTTLARQVILEELQQRPELIVTVLREALKQLPSRNHPLRIHLHPDDQVILEVYAKTADETMTWLPNPTIERGGCIVESGASRIDATVETRLQQNIAAIWGELAPPEMTP